MLSQCGEGSPEQVKAFLAFTDWIHQQPLDPPGWIIVGQHNGSEAGDFFTMSALLQPKNDISILDRQKWDVNNTFGKPFFWSAGGDTSARYDPGEMETRGNDLTFYPFAIFRNLNGIVGERFELRQEFLLYHDTYLDDATGEYRRIDCNGAEIAVAKYIQCDENIMLLCEEHELRDFLAAKNCALVRYHDHRRFSMHSAKDIIEGVGKRNHGSEGTTRRIPSLFMTAELY